ncbi:MAG: hypothetical protein CL677_06060 [Bdellovibrionaceae bacterium]|nr:hypothetical protein [Pseudobdellovibrionaceae bacterium]|tara:strand:- start:71916 stop:72608 length:693 start_codon:yes stop_codon:yes gene_type:complete
MNRAFLISPLIALSLPLFARYVDKNGEKKEQFKSIYSFVNKHVGSCPKKIFFGHDKRKDGFSRFKGATATVTMAKPPEHENFKMILAHETSHICLFNKTNGASNTEPFRFFDEGLADIIGGRFVGGESNYKKKAFSKAKAWNKEGKVSFSKVQKWNDYFGNPPDVDFGAYMVGATFVYFILDSFGKDTLELFLIDIGKTKSLKITIKNIFDMNQDHFEKLWLKYIEEAEI